MRSTAVAVDRAADSARNLAAYRLQLLLLLFIVPLFALTVSACTPTAEANVVGYLITKRTNRLTAQYKGPTGTVTGFVQSDGKALSGATVLVAERNGSPHSAQTGDDGRYIIEQVPPGRYVPAAVAPGYEEALLQGTQGIPQIVTVIANQQTELATFELNPYHPPVLPANLATATQLSIRHTAIVTAAFPPGAEAEVTAYEFTYAAAQVDTLRLYLPTNTETRSLPLLYMIYPTAVDLWQSVSTAYAAEGFAVLAISPLPQRGLDIDAHATDAYVALSLAQSGALGDRIASSPAVALGGSFSSAVLHRFLRNYPRLPATAVGQSSGQTDGLRKGIAGWVTVGGIANAFQGTHEFYAGQITIPEEYTYLIPALGAPNLYPLNFLRYSPVYTAAQLPPTLIIHTAADRIIPIEQAYELEAALRAADVPVDVFYYEDVSHYLQIDDQMTDAGREMFYRVGDFADRILREGIGR
ncbi:MAG: carboxypeptidase regulatory-like domain-containing protein [Caldilineaceae bacterium]